MLSCDATLTGAMDQDTLRQLIASCRRARTRFVGSPPDLPSDWCPTRIKNPAVPDGFNIYFTDESAWNFIADHLEQERPFKLLTLDVPAGATAIVIEVSIRNYDRPLYIKVQVGKSNAAIGRSFHISHR